MALLQRLLRAFNTLSTAETDDRTRFGALGEEYAGKIIDHEQGTFSISNPIIPHPTKPGLYLEGDFLVYTQGNLFSVEIKNYKGQISYLPRYREMQIKKRWLFFFTRTVFQQVQDGYDDSKILQQKVGKYGEGTFVKEYANPLKKNRYFIHHLKQYLTQIDTRFKNLYIIPVVGFGDYADIRQIYSFEQGMITIKDIPAFFDKHANQRFNGTIPGWILEGLQRIPTWDKVLTNNDQLINGILEDKALTFTDANQKHYSIPYSTIETVTISRKIGFSEFDDIQIVSVGGKKQHFTSSRGHVRLEHFGDHQSHEIRHLKKIIVGVANK